MASQPSLLAAGGDHPRVCTAGRNLLRSPLLPVVREHLQSIHIAAPALYIAWTLLPTVARLFRCATAPHVPPSLIAYPVWKFRNPCPPLCSTSLGGEPPKPRGSAESRSMLSCAFYAHLFVFALAVLKNKSPPTAYRATTIIIMCYAVLPN